jgi:acetyltransferase
MDLTPLMKPTSVAVVGASQRMGRATRVVANLQRFGYAGRVFPINPKYPDVLGLPCYPDLASTPAPADVVVVAIPAEQVPGLLEAAVESGVRAAVILSSGFGEAGPVGKARQATLERLAAEQGLLICGPNCYGVFNLREGVATFSADLAEPLRPGAVGLVSQSGGFSHAIAEHLMQQRLVGLSYIVSCGNQAGVTVEDYVEFLVEDEDTEVIGVFVEGFRQPAKLRQVAAQARERGKPIVALKVGQSENAREAMLAHTGSLAGTPEIVEAALRQWGIVPVESLNEMLDTLTLLAAARRRRRGWRVTVLSGLGGECGRLADVAERAGVELPPLSPASVTTLKSFMPDFANPRTRSTGRAPCTRIPSCFPACSTCSSRMKPPTSSPSTCAPMSRGRAPGRRHASSAGSSARPSRAARTGSSRASARSPAAISTPRSCARWRRRACRFSRARRPRCAPCATRASTAASSTDSRATQRLA